MSSLVYRKIRKSDYSTVKKLINVMTISTVR